MPKSQVSKSTTPSGGSNFRLSSSTKVEATSNVKKTSYPAPSGTSSMGSTAKSSSIQCFKCLGRGHMQRDCPNNKVMLMMDNGEFDSASDEEADLGRHDDAHCEEKEEANEVVYCDTGVGPILVCTPSVLSVQPKYKHEQRCNLFQTRAQVSNDDKFCKVIIDGGSCHNLASKELCTKLGLRYKKHPHPYQIQWLHEHGSMSIGYTVDVEFEIGSYRDTVECDVVSMNVSFATRKAMAI